MDERRLGLASLADAQSLALTTTFNNTDTGLQSQDDGTDVRCELLTVARTEQPEVAAAINAAADTFEKAGGLLPAQPGVMLPSILDAPNAYSESVSMTSCKMRVRRPSSRNCGVCPPHRYGAMNRPG